MVCLLLKNSILLTIFGFYKIRNKWTNEEIDIIKNNYKNMNDIKLHELIPNHSIKSITSKRKKLGFLISNKKYSFKDVLEEFSKNNNLQCLASESDYVDSAQRTLPYICKKHKNKGIQYTSLGHLQNGRGCFYCGRERNEQAKRLTNHEADLSCKNICIEHGFEYVGYERSAEDCRYYILYICPKHRNAGIQKMAKGNMNRENIVGCPYCFDSKRFKFSKGEKAVESFLKNHNEDYICQYTFDDCRDKCMLPFDFYLTSKNICIEFDGQHHYYPVQFNGVSVEDAIINHNKTKLHDEIKNNYCSKNNIKLIRIPYFNFKNIEEILRKGIYS